MIFQHFFQNDYWYVMQSKSRCIFKQFLIRNMLKKFLTLGLLFRSRILTWKKWRKNFSIFVLNYRVTRNPIFSCNLPKKWHFLKTFVCFCSKVAKLCFSLIWKFSVMRKAAAKSNLKHFLLVLLRFTLRKELPEWEQNYLPCQLVHFPRVLTKRSRGKKRNKREEVKKQLFLITLENCL